MIFCIWSLLPIPPPPSVLFTCQVAASMELQKDNEIKNIVAKYIVTIKAFFLNFMIMPPYI